jgi:hypothetical protein
MKVASTEASLNYIIQFHELFDLFIIVTKDFVVLHIWLQITYAVLEVMGFVFFNKLVFIFFELFFGEGFEAGHDLFFEFI